MRLKISKPQLLTGDIAIDDRGILSFCNEFNLSKYKRFYVVSNFQDRFIRAWHGHLEEEKAVFVISGSALVGAVELDDPHQPNKLAKPSRFILSEKKPSILLIPKGYANGFMTLESETQVIFFSSHLLKTSSNDDYRYPYDYWDIWATLPR